MTDKHRFVNTRVGLDRCVWRGQLCACTTHGISSFGSPTANLLGLLAVKPLFVGEAQWFVIARRLNAYRDIRKILAGPEKGIRLTGTPSGLLARLTRAKERNRDICEVERQQRRDKPVTKIKTISNRYRDQPFPAQCTWGIEIDTEDRTCRLVLRHSPL